jgi:hypothetical protein
LHPASLLLLLLLLLSCRSYKLPSSPNPGLTLIGNTMKFCVPLLAALALALCLGSARANDLMLNVTVKGCDEK